MALIYRALHVVTYWAYRHGSGVCDWVDDHVPLYDKYGAGIGSRIGSWLWFTADALAVKARR